VPTEPFPFTRGRPYRKNDNCFVEQKNDLVVRKTVGYARFDTEEEYEALAEVYRHLCPLVNFYYPSMKLVEKERVGSRVKKRYEGAKTPYLRLLESEDVEDRVKEELKRRAAALHIVQQKRQVDQAVARLLQICKQKYLSLAPTETVQEDRTEVVHVPTVSTKKEKKKQKEKETTTTTTSTQGKNLG
jgi:hypothetical protein